MASLKAIRKRISSVRNIQQITKAMKIVSAARLRRAQENAFAARPYAEKLEAVLQNLAAQYLRTSTESAHPFLTQREEKKVHLLLITSDRGLCGSYNTNLIRTAETFVRERQEQEVSFTIVGRKGFEHFHRRQFTITEHHINLFGRLTPALAQEISRKLGERLSQGEIDGVYVLYSHFRSVLSQVITLERLLPIVAREETEMSDRDRSSPPSSVPVSLEYLYEPTPQELIASLLERYVNMLVYRAMLEGVASEHGARMTAMDNATNNAVEMISRLTLEMNRARQAAITKELLEIVSTGEALRA